MFPLLAGGVGIYKTLGVLGDEEVPVIVSPGFLKAKEA